MDAQLKKIDEYSIELEKMYCLQVCEGDRVIVDATNMMRSESTTLHWHGQHMVMSPYMDGTPFVTQCPIPPGTSFRYDFVAETPGTHFWHSHVGEFF